MEREVLVYAELAGVPVLVGRLWSHLRGGKESASFEYDRTWLARKGGFALEPELPFSAGQFHSARPLFNVFGDASPDRWGQNLLRRNERARARNEGRTPRTLFAFDFLTGVADETRLGALRFQDARGSFLSSLGRPVPPLFELGRLLAATRRIVEERETDADLELVLAPGTSLGGARPKASIRDRDGALAVAKFPRQDDDVPVTRWEATALALASNAAIDVPPFRLELVAKRPVTIVRRFDRRGAVRIPFVSALTALAAADGESRSYLEIAEAIRREGSQVDRDLKQLWRRMVFNILISNTDDHLRNHGFVRDAAGWRLAPAYDLNPTPTDVRPRIHALAIDELDATASLETALSVAPSFGVAKASAARTIAREVARAVAKWPDAAGKAGIGPRQRDRMASAFEHDDARLGRGVRAPVEPSKSRRR